MLSPERRARRSASKAAVARELIIDRLRKSGRGDLVGMVERADEEAVRHCMACLFASGDVFQALQRSGITGRAAAAG